MPTTSNHLDSLSLSTYMSFSAYIHISGVNNKGTLILLTGLYGSVDNIILAYISGNIAFVSYVLSPS